MLSQSRESTEFVIFNCFYYLQFDSYATVSANSFCTEILLLQEDLLLQAAVELAK
jgi:hypothetical protein